MFGEKTRFGNCFCIKFTLMRKEFIVVTNAWVISLTTARENRKFFFNKLISLARSWMHCSSKTSWFYVIIITITRYKIIHTVE